MIASEQLDSYLARFTQRLKQTYIARGIAALAFGILIISGTAEGRRVCYTHHYHSWGWLAGRTAATDYVPWRAGPEILSRSAGYQRP